MRLFSQLESVKIYRIRKYNLKHGMFEKQDARTRHKTINNKTITKKEETTAQKSLGSARAFFYLFGANCLQK